eukprot:gene34201-biopygen19992
MFGVTTRMLVPGARKKSIPVELVRERVVRMLAEEWDALYGAAVPSALMWPAGTSEERIVSNVIGLVKEGQLGKAVRRLHFGFFAPLSPETLEAMQAMHSAGDGLPRQDTNKKFANHEPSSAYDSRLVFFMAQIPDPLSVAPVTIWGLPALIVALNDRRAFFLSTWATPRWSRVAALTVQDGLSQRIGPLHAAFREIIPPPIVELFILRRCPPCLHKSRRWIWYAWLLDCLDVLLAVLDVGAVEDGSGGDPNGSIEIVVFVAMLTTFFFFFRKNDVSVEKADAWNPRGQLVRSDVSLPVAEDGTRQVEINVRHSKTIHAGERCHTVRAVEVPSSPICVFMALWLVLQMAGLGQEGALFCTEDAKGRLKPLTHSVFVAGIRKLAARAGLDPSAYTGHTFRCGEATAAFKLQVHDALIHAHGDWASECYKLYCDMDSAQQFILPSAMITGAADATHAFEMRA